MSRPDPIVHDERQRALRALLARPLLTAAQHGDELALVRRHRAHLTDWLLRHPGWGLQVEAELARLVRTPVDPCDPSHPARDPRHHQPFSRIRYVLWCLALAHCERAGRQTTLNRLADDLLRQIAADAQLGAAGIVCDPTRRESRADLVAVGRLLQHWGVVTRRQGDEEAFLAGGGSDGATAGNDALYTICRPVLARLLAVRVGPSLIATPDPAALQAEPPPSGDEDRRRHLRRRLLRHLLEKPVLYQAELDPDALAYWRNQRHALCALAAEATGLEVELRAEGVALIDREGNLDDLPLGGEGTDGHAALLLASWLAGELRAGSQLVPYAAIEARLTALADSHGGRWRREAQGGEGLRELTASLIERFAAGDLIRLTPDGVRPLPILTRWAAPPEPGPQPRQQSLFP
jgi:uncharacterized protein (TIGR02678 family)